MDGNGPFLWLNEKAPRFGFRHVPPGGMCVSAFLLVRRGGELLVGKYREHPAWERLTGLDADRVSKYHTGWTLPARQLKYGEDPREAARQIGEEVLGLRGLRYGEPHIEVDHYSREPGAPPPQVGDVRAHYDMSFVLEAVAPPGIEVQVPEWYAELTWCDRARLHAQTWSRGHEDIVARWLKRTAVQQ